MKNIVFLYGPPASGKTTLGAHVAKALKVPFIDLDAVIVERAGKSIAAVFAQEGEAAFRDLESTVLADVIREHPDTIGGDNPPVQLVVALGGGTLLRDENRRLCEEHGSVLCLETPSQEILNDRLAQAKGVRPLGDMSQARAAHYASFSNRIAAFFDSTDSLVIVGDKIARPLAHGHWYTVDEHVAELWSTPKENRVAVIPSGEVYKTAQTVSMLWHALAKKDIGRHDMVVSVGGGVTGDLTGFATASWMRGIDWINVPTTLLAMVDASTGGKTGFDLPEGKNLVGAFHMPRLVIVDLDFLTTLSPNLLLQGLAEMVKHNVIRGRDMFAHENVTKLGGVRLPTAQEVAQSLLVKVSLVKEDPFETKGLRLLLNCGHTVAHAIEKLSGYEISHGEAVAMGCVEEARLAVRMGLAPAAWPDELAALFAREGIPTKIPEAFTFEMMKPVMRLDKKSKGSVVTFAMPCGWGDVRAVDVDLS